LIFGVAFFDSFFIGAFFTVFFFLETFGFAIFLLDYFGVLVLTLLVFFFSCLRSSKSPILITFFYSLYSVGGFISSPLQEKLPCFS